MAVGLDVRSRSGQDAALRTRVTQETLSGDLVLDEQQLASTAGTQGHYRVAALPFPEAAKDQRGRHRLALEPNLAWKKHKPVSRTRRGAAFNRVISLS